MKSYYSWEAAEVFYKLFCRPSGEMETDEQDDESSQDQELPSENDNSQSEDSVGGDNELENGVVAPQNSTKGQQTAGHNRKRLFTFQFNNMGKTDFLLIKEDTRQIRFDEGHLRLSGRKSSLSIIKFKIKAKNHQIHNTGSKMFTYFKFHENIYSSVTA